MEMEDKPPSWLAPMLQRQTENLSSMLDRHLSRLQTNEPVSPGPPPASAPGKKTKKQKHIEPPPSPSSHPQEPDSDDDFDRRFGHLIGDGTNDDDGRHREEEYFEEESQEDIQEDRHEKPKKKRSSGDVDSDDSEGNASVDDGIVQILKKVPNFDTSSSISKFLMDSANDPLPDEFLKDLNDEYVPKEALQKYFAPPPMPSRLYKSLARMKSKGAFKTEKAMYSAQNELFIIAKPLLAAFIQLRPLGNQVLEARNLMSISLHGIFSVSLKISGARRENVRFLFKESLADALYTFPPQLLLSFWWRRFLLPG